MDSTYQTSSPIVVDTEATWNGSPSTGTHRRDHATNGSGGSGKTFRKLFQRKNANVDAQSASGTATATATAVAAIADGMSISMTLEPNEKIIRISSTTNNKTHDGIVSPPIIASTPEHHHHILQVDGSTLYESPKSPTLKNKTENRGIRGRFQNLLSSREGAATSSNSASRQRSNSSRRRSLRRIITEEKKEMDVSGSHSINNNNNTPRRSPKREHLFQWQDAMEEAAVMEQIQKKQQYKTRDGFCRQVDGYDGNVISVDGQNVYELCNYLGGGVAGVVYEGQRLRPLDEYPVRLGLGSDRNGSVSSSSNRNRMILNADGSISRNSLENNGIQSQPPETINVGSFLCVPNSADAAVSENPMRGGNNSHARIENRDASLLTVDTGRVRSDAWSSIVGQSTATNVSAIRSKMIRNDLALEATDTGDQLVIIDTVDAPSRSKHYAKAVSGLLQEDLPEDTSIRYGFMEETVAIKVLNPVGFRTIAPSVIVNAVVARPGIVPDRDVKAGLKPLTEQHVWWLVNPNSRNLRTLQRYTGTVNGPSRRIEIDRGSQERGLRISLIAAYRDFTTGMLCELPLTKCIDIWGHVPFGASDVEFDGIMEAIDLVNAGQPPPPLPAFLRLDEGDFRSGRIGTDGTGATAPSTDDSNSATGTGGSPNLKPVSMTSKRT
jgi:hypothetical protein